MHIAGSRDWIFPFGQPDMNLYSCSFGLLHRIERFGAHSGSQLMVCLRPSVIQTVGLSSVAVYLWLAGPKIGLPYHSFAHEYVDDEGGP